MHRNPDNDPESPSEPPKPPEDERPKMPPNENIKEHKIPPGHRRTERED